MKTLEETKSYIKGIQEKDLKHLTKSYVDSCIYHMLNAISFVYNIDLEELIDEFELDMNDID